MPPVLSYDLSIALLLLMVIMFMTHRQLLLHEIFEAFGIDEDAHWIAGRRGVVAEDLSHLVEQSNRRIQKIFGRKPRRM